MKKQITSALLAGVLSLVPVAGMAAAQKPAAAKTPTAKASVATHATRGTVKSLDDSTLVITSTGKTHTDMTFTVNGSTQREGTIATGTPVSVRYHQDGTTNIATAIHAESAKKKSGSK